MTQQPALLSLAQDILEGLQNAANYTERRISQETKTHSISVPDVKAVQEKQTTRQRIYQLLAPYDDSQTECDGMTRICHTVLVQHSIKHQVFVGSVSQHHEGIEPHFWIDLPNGERIDYRVRMWLGIEGIPHGIFDPLDFPDIIYTGEPIELEILSPELFEILNSKFDNF